MIYMRLRAVFVRLELGRLPASRVQHHMNPKGGRPLADTDGARKGIAVLSVPRPRAAPKPNCPPVPASPPLAGWGTREL